MSHRSLLAVLATALAVLSSPALGQENVSRPAYQRLQLAGANLPRQSVLNFGTGLTCSDNPGARRTDCALAAGAGVPTSRQVLTTSPLSGGGPLAADITLSCPTCVVGSDARVAPAPTGAGKVLYDTGAAYAATGVGNANQVLHGAAGTPTWGQVGNADLVNNSVTVSTSLPLGGGGVVGLGGTLTLTCATCVSVSATTKGDVAVFNGTAWLRLGVGTDGQALTADSTQPTGVKWAAAGGGGGKLATDYTAGGSAADQTFLIQAGKGGPVVAKANGAGTGQLLATQTSTGAALVTLTDNGANSLVSGAADAGGSVAAIVDTTAAWSTATKLVSFRNGGTEQSVIDTTGGLVSPGTPYGVGIGSGQASFGSLPTGGVMPIAGLQVSPGSLILVNGGTKYRVTNAGILPDTDNVGTLGNSSNRWNQVWARQHIGFSQVVASSATPAIDCTAGETVHVGTIFSNVTGATMASAGAVGQFCTVIFEKNATTNAYTVAFTGSNVRTAGTLTMSTTASSLLSVSFRWDDRLGTPAWVQTSATPVQ